MLTLTKHPEADALAHIAERAAEEATDMQIIITTDANPEVWGDECDKWVALQAAAKLAIALEGYARTAWPNAEIDAGAGYGYVNTRSMVSVRYPGESDLPMMGEATEVKACIDEVARGIWTDVLEQAIEEEAGLRANA
jgi:hypothetical protein